MAPTMMRLWSGGPNLFFDPSGGAETTGTGAKKSGAPAIQRAVDGGAGEGHCLPGCNGRVI